MSFAILARAPVLNIPGAIYHVMNRGNRKELIFLDDWDRYRFIRILTDTAAEFGVDVLADCQMGTHFHLVVLNTNGNLPEFMQQLEGQFAQYLNKRHLRVGHVFQGPFRRVLIEHDIHLLIAINYVLMNPITAGLVSRLEDWKWSSYLPTAGLAPPRAYLSTTWLDDLFPAESHQQSQERFREFMNNPQPIESYLTQGPVFGSDSFKQVIRSYVEESLFRVYVPRSYRALSRPSLEELLPPGLSHQGRALAIQRACVVYGYRQSEIARALALHPASVSRIVCSLRKAAGQ